MVKIMKNIILFIVMILAISCRNSTKVFRLDDKLFSQWQQATNDSIKSLINQNVEFSHSIEYQNLIFYSKSNYNSKLREWIRTNLPDTIKNEIESSDLKQLLVVEYYREASTVMTFDLYFFVGKKEKSTGYLFRTNRYGISLVKTFLFKVEKVNRFLNQIQPQYNIMVGKDSKTGSSNCISGELSFSVFSDGEVHIYHYLTRNFNDDQFLKFG